MTVEPQNAYTVLRRPLLPPKPARTIPQPTLSMTEEAAQVRARFRKTWGNLSANASGEDANAKRKAVADARRDELAAKAMELLAERELTSSQMRDLCHASENQMRNALGYLRAEGMAGFKRKGGIWLWFIEVAAE